jgi:hypothetical protein
MAKLKLHEVEFLTESKLFSRVAVPGGWVYRIWDITFGDEAGYTALCFVPSPRAPHVRDARRLRLREGWKKQPYQVEDGWVTLWRNLGSQHVAMCEYSPGRFVAIHADGSETDHATRLEVHDALIASGSESPFAVVTGPAVAKVEGGAS